jgi:hypothetical protein
MMGSFTTAVCQSAAAGGLATPKVGVLSRTSGNTPARRQERSTRIDPIEAPAGAPLGQFVGRPAGTGSRVSTCRLYHLSCRVLWEAGVLVMTLWDEVGGRTWTERAGLRSAGMDAETRPSRRRRARRVRRALARPVASGRRTAGTPVRRVEEGTA